MLRLITFIALLVAIAPRVHSQDLSGLFSSEGIETRADQRLFTLFSLFNAMGYNREGKRGPKPLEAPLFSPLRQDVRTTLFAKKIDDKAARTFIAANPKPVDFYIDLVLQLGLPPEFQAPENASTELSELSKILKAYYAERGAEVFKAYESRLRESAKVWLKEVDGVSLNARKTLRLSDDVDFDLEEEESGDFTEEEEEGLRLVVMANPLDAHGTSYYVAHKDIHYLVLGPTKGNAQSATDPVLVSTISLVLRPVIAKTLKKMNRVEIAKAISAQGGYPEGFKESEDLLVALLARSFAKSVTGRKLELPPSLPMPKSPALQTATDTAVTWFTEQKQPFRELSVGLLTKMLGLKPPPEPSP